MEGCGIVVEVGLGFSEGRRVGVRLGVLDGGLVNMGGLREMGVMYGCGGEIVGDLGRGI